MDGPLFELLHSCTARLEVSGGHGTGFFVAPGLVLTCAHVVEKAESDVTRITVHYGGKRCRVQKIECYPKPYPDLALLHIDLREHPCVYLDASVEPRDQLYSYGYTEKHLAGESTTLESEGAMRTDDGELLLKLKSGQVLRGSSGSPLLNERTWGVCGVVKLSRDRLTALGGGAIPTEVVLSKLPKLTELQEAFHKRDSRWMDACAQQRGYQVERVAPRTKVAVVFYEEVGNVHKPERLFGRDELLTEVNALLDGYRRVLLYGLAGTGKTALAATIADQRISNKKGPYIWVQPGDENANAVFDALVERFATEKEKQEIAFLTGDAKTVAVGNLLTRSEAALLVLDDVWNGQALRRVLEAAPDDMPVLVTSRQKFALDEMVDVGDLPPDEALNLLSYHAGQKDYSADVEARRLCEQLGHHAYALEIAGTTLKVDELTPAELCEEVADAPHEMRMPGRFAADGRESVKELLDRSFHVLEAETQAVFRAFGAFFAPGATSMLLAMYMGREKRGVEEALRNLVRRSLAKRLKGTDYYYIHDLTFTYAQTMFKDEEPDYQATVTAIQHYVMEHVQDFDRLALDYTNILEAARVAQVKDVEALISIVSVLATGGYMDARGHTPDFLTLLDETIGAVIQKGTEQNETLHHLLGKRGNAFFDRGDWERAFEAYQAALELAPNPARKAMLLGAIGKVCSRQGRYDEADGYFGQGHELAQANHDDRALAFVLEQQSVAAGHKGDFETARQFAAQAVEVNRRLEDQDPLGMGYSLLNLGSAEFETGIHKALSIHQRVYEIARDEGDLDLMALVLYALGCDYHALYEYDEARKHLREARGLFRKIGCTAEETEVTVFMKQFGYTVM
jgi:hypothetical protein